MKRILKKKLNLFGKEVSVLVVALLGVMLVSAALVSYVGTTLTGNVEISAPMECWFENVNGENIGSGLLDIPMSSGEIKFYTRCVGHGDVDAYGIMIKVTGPKGWTGDEFESVNLRDRQGGTGGAVVDKGNILSYLYHVTSETSIVNFNGITGNPTTVNLFASRPDSGAGELLGQPITFLDHYDASTDIWNEITIVPKANIYPGNYSIQMCYVYDLDSPICEEPLP